MLEKKWKLLRRRKVFQSRIAKVYQDDILLPNGTRIKDYTVIEKPNYVKIVAVDKNKRVLVQREYRHAVQRYLWELPGGFIDKGESPVETARRELKEETGYSGGKFRFVGTLSDYGSTDTHVGYVVLATEISKGGAQQLEDTESITEVQLIPLTKIKKMIVRNEFEGTSSISALSLSGILF